MILRQLELKPEGEITKAGNVVGLTLGFDEFDGPPTYCAETSTGNKYVYSTYALFVPLGTAYERFLWESISPTLRKILDDSKFTDPVILWRWRPQIERDEGKSYLSMRCVAIPRAEVENILPAEAFLSQSIGPCK